jgi:hypothetical protein
VTSPADDVHELRRSVVDLFLEVFDGPGSVAFVLNTGDPGLLASLRRLSARDASERPGGRSSVAAHVDHLRYGLELLNRSAAGEDPWADADYSASWRRQEVGDAEWQALLDSLESEARAWITALNRLQNASALEWTTSVSSAVHLAYHAGAIRQIARSAAGPRARD